MVHIPSFLVGSAFSGISFLAVQQQLSYRNRLTWKWPIAELIEHEFRSRWKKTEGMLRSGEHLSSKPTGEGQFSKQWNLYLEKAQTYFQKND